MRRLCHLFRSVRSRFVLLSLLLPVFAGAAEQRPTGDTDIAELRAWIGAMKTETRGPVARIRWFCNDGTVLSPKPFACRERGGGIQHDEWNERARNIRARGFSIANVLAELEQADVLSTDNKLLQQLLLGPF